MCHRNIVLPSCTIWQVQGCGHLTEQNVRNICFVTNKTVWWLIRERRGFWGAQKTPSLYLSVGIWYEFIELCVWLVRTDTGKGSVGFVVREPPWLMFETARRHTPEDYIVTMFIINNWGSSTVVYRTSQLGLGHRVSAPSSVCTDVSFSKLLNNFHWKLYRLYKWRFVERVWHCVLVTLEGHTCPFTCYTNIAVSYFVFTVDDMWQVLVKKIMTFRVP